MRHPPFQRLPFQFLEMESREKSGLCSNRSRIQRWKKKGIFSLLFFISFRFVSLVVESERLKLFLIDNSEIQRWRQYWTTMCLKGGGISRALFNSLLSFIS